MKTSPPPNLRPQSSVLILHDTHTLRTPRTPRTARFRVRPWCTRILLPVKP
jgi:hypothetical protein